MVTLVGALLLWKLVKLTVKVVVFLVATAVIAGVVALYVSGGLPGRPGIAPPAIPVPIAPR
ncbi:MAG: hypothetical protein IT383_11060 [Deltaproteobacteria bacterium]|nr:hypothetical protein [Deltaproteobacteria bacterium]